MCPLPLMSTGIGLILSRSSGGAMPPFGSAGKCLREEPGGVGRNELSANAIAASTHRPHRCSENVFTYRHQAAARNWGDYLTGHYKAPEQSHSPSLVNLGA